MSVKETRRVRELDELIDLQDKAIQALQQAQLALSLALQALQQSLAEKGDQQKLPGLLQTPFTQIPYTQLQTPIQIPFYMPYGGGIQTYSGTLCSKS